MAFECTKGHMHVTQLKADTCYICKRRAAKKSAKRARQEQEEELAYLVHEKNPHKQLKKFKGDE